MKNINLYLFFVLSLISLPSFSYEYPFYLRTEEVSEEGRKIPVKQIIAFNEGPAPVSVVVNIAKPSNVSFHPMISGNGFAITIPPNSKQILTTAKTIKDIKPMSFRYSYSYFFGSLVTNFKNDVSFKIPFPDGYVLSAKSYNGPYAYSKTYSINLVNAMQFYLPEKTPILAARPGVVVDVRGHVDGSDYAKPSPFGNYVFIMHQDGTLSLYANLNDTSVSVKPLDYVATGQQIAYSQTTEDNNKSGFLFGVLVNAGGNKAKSIPFMIETKDEVVLSSKVNGFITSDDVAVNLSDPYVKQIDEVYSDIKKQEPELKESAIEAGKHFIGKFTEDEPNKEDKSEELTNEIYNNAGDYVYYFFVALAAMFVLSMLVKFKSSDSSNQATSKKKKNKLSISFQSKYDPVDTFISPNLQTLIDKITPNLPKNTSISANIAFSSFLNPTTFKLNFLNNPISSLYADIFLYTTKSSVPIAVIDLENSVVSKFSKMIFNRKKSVLSSASLPYARLKHNADSEKIIATIRELHIETLSKVSS